MPATAAAETTAAASTMGTEPAMRARTHLRTRCSHLRAAAHPGSAIHLRTAIHPGTAIHLRTITHLGAFTCLRARLHPGPGSMGRSAGRLVVSTCLRASGNMVTAVGGPPPGMMPTMGRTNPRMMSTTMVPAMRRSHTGMMPGGVVMRHRHPVHMGRVMPVAAIPGRRAPVRHQARSCDSGYGKDSHTRGCVTIHRSAIGIAVNRETVHIIARVGPLHRGAPTGAAHPHRGARVHGVIVHHARTQHYGRPGHQSYVFQSFLHCDTGGCLQ